MFAFKLAANKKQKRTEKTIHFVFICTFTFHTLLRNFDGFSWSPSKLRYFRSGSVGMGVRFVRVLIFSLTFSLLVCFSSSSYVVCTRKSWENPNTSRTSTEQMVRRRESGQWRFVTQTIVQILCIVMHLSWFMCMRDPRLNFRMLHTFFRYFYFFSFIWVHCVSFALSFFSFLSLLGFLFVVHSIEFCLVLRRWIDDGTHHRNPIFDAINFLFQ